MGTKPKTVNAEFLAKIWNIKNELASKVINQNTHLCIRGEDKDLSRLLSTNDRMLQYKRINSQFFTNTLFVTKKATSTRGNTGDQFFVSDKGYVAIYPMKRRVIFMIDCICFARRLVCL